MRAWITGIFLAVFASAGAQANSITIGQFQYLGTNPQGVSGFKVILNTTGVTAFALMLKDLRLTENGTAENAGAITTPTAILFLGGPGFRLPACPCESLQIQLFFPTTEKVFTLQLAGGGFFTTRSTPRFFLRPLPGQRFLLPGQSASVVLTSVPEPGTLALFSGGLAAVVFYRRRWNLRRVDRGQVRGLLIACPRTQEVEFLITLVVGLLVQFGTRRTENISGWQAPFCPIT